MAHPGRRKASILLVALLLATEAGIFGFASHAQAQTTVIGGPLAPEGSVKVYDTASMQTYQLNNVADVVRIGVVGSAMMALLNSVNWAAQQIAYDTATQISEGNIGKKTFFNNKGFKDYFNDIADGAIGEFIGTLNESGLAPFDLCDPNNFRLKIALALGLIGDVQPKPPLCRWNEIKSKYKEFGQNVKTGEALKQFGIGFEPAQSGLGVTVDSSSKLATEVAKRQNAALQDRLEGGGFSSVTELISGRIKTPSELVQQKALEGAATGKEAQTMSYQLMGQTLVAAPGFIAVNALNTFTTHLVATLLKKAIGDGLYWSLYDATCYLGITGCGGVNDADYGSSPNDGQVRNQNSDLITPPLQMDSKYDAISEFSSCPDDARGLNNCAIDSQFAAAISRASLQNKYLTVKEAMDQGYLHGDWPLISNSEVHRARNADPYCFANGYCYSNLVKLRKHRILPIGWELAAAKSPPDPVKLSEVVAKFDDCPTADDPNPANHPWCHLIDPNWVLKLPVTQCRLRVNGPTLLTPEAPTRAQYCADTPSCVAEDKYGNCTSGYGYCVREKNIWRLGGTECKAPYASCASFTSRGGESLLALQNTIDHGICTSDNVGCRPYATKREASSTPVWSYEPGMDRVFLNRNAAECEADGAGCTKVYDKEKLRRNLVLNSSFEQDVVENSNLYPNIWGDLGWPSEVEWNQNSDFVRTGARSIKPYPIGQSVPIGTFGLRQQITVEPDITYTVSYYARQSAPQGPGQAEMRIWLMGAKDGVKGITGLDFPQDLMTCDHGAAGSVGYGFLRSKPAGVAWERVSCVFTIPADGYRVNNVRVHPSAIQIMPGRLQNQDVWIDDIQLEEGSFVTDYHDSAFEGVAARTIKVPPESLLCTGDDTQDVPACKGYSRVCRADEVGCDRYTPEAGGTPVSGIVADKDYCPYECVGYQTFRKEKSEYDIEAYPKYFIPATAAQCSASAVGCTEFTNLDSQAAGGEAREYFSYIRRCEKPSGAIPTYYTWEGSDTAGYQLKEWHLKPEAVQTPGGGFAPVVSSNLGCDQGLYQAGLSSPDCREFYDEGGNVSYRLYSKTTVITDDCHPYRMTQMPKVEDKTVTTEGACSAQGNGYHWLGTATSGSCYVCEAIGGVYDATTSECTFLGYRSESNVCQAAENGCRLYSGNAGGNIQTVISDDFESDSLADWDKAIQFQQVGSTPVIAVSTESTIVGGHSLRILRSTSKVWRAMTTITPGAFEIKGIYFVDFWAKGPGMKLNAIQLKNPKTGDLVSFTPTPGSAVSLTGNWKSYSLGPIILNFDPNDKANGGLVNLEFGGDANSTTDYWFLDNLTLRKVGSAVSVIKDSWKTPPSCDLTNSGTVLPQAQLGCAAYSDRKSQKVSLKSFDKLCRDAAVGCRAFVDTRNNEFTGYEYWNLAAVNVDQSGNPTPVGSPTVLKDGPASVCTAATNNASCRYHKQTGLGIVSTLGGLGETHTYTTCVRQGAGYCYLDGVFICEIAKSAQTSDPNQTYQCSGMVPDLVTVPPDRSVYLVDDEKYACDSTQAGCTEVGLPSGSVCKLSKSCAPANGATSCPCSKDTEVCSPGKACEILNQFKCSVPTGKDSCDYALPDKEPYPALSYQTKYLVMDPSRYDGQVCTTNAVGCDEWRSSTKSAPALSYFKNPDGRYCEYRENVKVGGIDTSGYYIQGTDEPCDPTYVIGGGYYGIRKNSDPNYHGFAGSCPSDQVGCTEYIDPGDVRQVRTDQVTVGGSNILQEVPVIEPQRYYYIKDQSIDYGSCNGQASQKNGCVLLNDTSDQNLYYNSVGTYDDSTAKQYASVAAKPGICQFALGACPAPAQFTGKLGTGYLNVIDEFKAILLTGSAFGDVGVLPFNSFNATYYKDGLDFVALETACKASGEQAPVLYDEAGCYNDADCTSGGLQGKCRLDKKDSNSVIAVSRDRICGAWYACKSSSPQWDPRTSSYRDTCDEIGLCDESSVATNSSPTVDVTSCRHWVTSVDQSQILSEDLYRKRDVSWTGLEYTGYAVPHMFPAQSLSQATLDKLCRWPGAVKKCSSDAQCKYSDGNTYPCLPQNSLGHEIGDGCSVDDGKPCSIGECDWPSGRKLCSSDSACVDSEGVGHSCKPLIGECVWPGAKKSCSSDASCKYMDGKTYPCTPSGSSEFKGTCYQHKCYQSPFGNTDPAFADEPQPLQSAVANNPLELSCRAYPEPDSPVPGSDVVISYDSEIAGGNVPTSVKQGFQSANYCQKGSDCECSYKKAIFTDQSSAKYYGLYNKATPQGICVGGDYDGQPCVPDDDMNSERYKTVINGIVAGSNLSCTKVKVTPPETPAGTCQSIKRTDIVRGLEGFCLERDEATSIYGREIDRTDAPSRACYTWLPVDRISGQPDMFNQYTQATYEIRDSYMCLVPEMYKAFHTYGMADGGDDVGDGDQWVITDTMNDRIMVGCAMNHDCGNGPYNNRCWIDNTKSNFMAPGRGNAFLDCPPDVGWIMMSYENDEYGAGHNGGRCPGTNYNDSDHDDLCQNGDDNYIYVCIPWGSVHTNPINAYGLYGKECMPSDVFADSMMGYWPHGVCKDGLPGQNPPSGVLGFGDGPWDAGGETIQSVVNSDVFNTCIENCDTGGVSPPPDTSYQGCTTKCGANPAFVGQNTEDPNSGLSLCLAACDQVYNICSAGCFGQAGSSEDLPICDSNWLPRFNDKYWPAENSPRDWAERAGQDASMGLKSGDQTPVAVIHNMCGPALGKMADCWKVDAPVTGWDKNYSLPPMDQNQQAYNSDNIGNVQTLFGEQVTGAGYYPGCTVVAQVSKAGGSDQDTNKANVENVGGSASAAAPNNSQPVALPNSISYEWGTGPTPYGLGTLRGIVDFVDTNVRMPFDVADVKNTEDAQVTKAYTYFSNTGGNICDGKAESCYTYFTDVATPYSISASRMHELFAKAYNFFGWSLKTDPANNHPGMPKGYVPLPEFVEQLDSTDLKNQTWDKLMNNSTFSELFKDVSIEEPKAEYRPQVMAPATCDIDGRCGESADRAMMLNSQTSGPLVGSGGSKRVSFKFFGDAGYGTEPIRDVEVIYDINNAPGKETLRASGQFLGLFKNHRGFVRDTSGNMVSVCDDSGFGLSKDACDDSAPFTFIHNYTCNSSSPHCEDGTDNCWQAKYPDSSDPNANGACVYHPGVYILNNWGICTGNCGNTTSPGGTLCSSNGGKQGYTIPGSDVYHKFNGETMGDECALYPENVFIAKNRPFVTYDGEVAVYPE